MVVDLCRNGVKVRRKKVNRKSYIERSTLAYLLGSASAPRQFIKTKQSTVLQREASCSIVLVVHSSMKPVCADSQKFTELLFCWLDPASFL